MKSMLKALCLWLAILALAFIISIVFIYMGIKTQ